MVQDTNLKTFYDEVNSLSNIVKNVDEKLNEKRTQIRSYVYSLEEKLNSINIDEQSLAKGLQEFFRSFKDSISVAVKKWEDTFEEKLKQEKLRSDLKNSFIVIIYGRVKAGKSSLGNFVARNRNADQNILFQKYDKKNQVYELKESEFATDIAECTDSIQLFKIGGLAWVDTPGLNSMTRENGELAKSYINAADFIIFPTSSDAPMQMDEISIVDDFINTFHKTITVVVTKSDETIEDEINGKIVTTTVNKSKESRDVQCKDVYSRLLGELKENSSLVGEIIPISIKTAEIGLKENNPELFFGSNVGSFLNMLRELVFKKADLLKKSSPYDGVKSTISVVNSELLKLVEQSNVLISKTESLEKKIQNILQSLEYVIPEFVFDLIESNDSKIVKGSDSTVYNKIVFTCMKTFNETCKSKIKKELTDFYEYTVKESKDLLNGEDFSVTDITRSVTKTTTYQTSGSILGGLIGGAIGFMFGGIGATAGATIGASLGCLGGSQIKDVESIPIVVGDNKLQIKQKLKDLCEKKCKKLIDENRQNIEKNFIIPNKKIFSSVHSSLLEVYQKLEDEKDRL